jgi:hypothetical protein
MGNKKKRETIFTYSVFSGVAVLCISAITYIWYRSISLDIPFNYKLSILLAVGVVLSLSVLLMPDNWKMNVSLLLLSVTTCVYSIELVLDIHYNYQLFGKDNRTKSEIIADLRSEGVDAWPHVPPWLFIESNGLKSGDDFIFPLGGISRKMIIYCKESDSWIIFKTDEHGFNNPVGIYRKGAARIALIGDSYVVGSCVPHSESFAGQLQSRGMGVLNLGNAGNGPLLEMATLKEYAMSVEPAVVLWVYYEGNDLSNLQDEQTSYILMHYLDDNFTQSLITRQQEIDAALINFVNSRGINLPVRKKRILRGIKLWYLRSKLGLLNPSNEAPTPDRTSGSRSLINQENQLPLFSQILAAARQQTSAWGGKFYFVYLPMKERYMNENNNGSFHDRDAVLAVVQKQGIPLIDFNEALDNYPDPLQLLSPAPDVRGHYNANGYKLLSAYIISRLREDKIISN